MSMNLASRVNILGVGITASNIPDVLGVMDQWIERRERHYVCVADVHSVMQAQWDPPFREVLNQSGITTSDGMPLVWLCKLERGKAVKRVYGPDLLLAACRHGLSTGRRHFFYGGAPGVAETLASRLKSQHPDLHVVGVYSPPFRPMDAAETGQVIDSINQAAPDIIWVGLGAPKQELWMHEMRPRLTAPVLLGVGAAFDFHSGSKPQAPKVLRSAGLEWLFRLATEPARLWPRYRRVVPSFIYRIALQKLGIASYSLDGAVGDRG
jgi:N-acetylglucosaminyldiphosphoundecaprenol N-acetyl-beta-D-mannosaminyltransferase